MMVIQNSPASGAVEGGRVLPEPGQEQAGSPEHDDWAPSLEPSEIGAAPKAGSA